MITVISLNILIALFGFYTAWRLWRLKTSLGGLTEALLRWDQNARHSLDPAAVPAVLLDSKHQAASLRHQYALVQLQWRRVKQLIRLLSLLPATARWARRRQQKKRSSR